MDEEPAQPLGWTATRADISWTPGAGSKGDQTMLITQSLRRAASVQPDRIALTAGPVRRTWAQLAERTPRLAGGLRALGLADGDRIAILSNNTAAFYELYLAAPWAGLVMVSLNTRWSPREMAEALTDCSAAGLVVDAEFADLAADLRKAAPSVRVLLASNGAAISAATSWEVLAEGEPIADHARGPDEAAYLFYTGGTTGRAKGVILSAMNIYVAGLSSLHTAGVSSRSNYSISVPLFHMSGGGLIAGQLAAAAGAQLLPRFEPEASMAAVEAGRATHVVWVPTMLTMLLNSLAFGRYDLSSLERILYGSAPMPQAVLARALEALPNVQFTQYYGMTELSGNATFLGPEAHKAKGENPRLRSVGIAVPGVEVKVIAPDGASAATDQVGEICVRGPTLTPGYWGQPDKTAEAIKDGWMHTGDLGRMDAGGYVFIVDRLKDMIVSGGENVYSSEVENALYQHPAVKECGVVGVPDEKWGEAVCAVVHLFEGASVSAEDLVAHCRTLIGGYKTPRRIVFSADPLPKSAAGKILKTELRAAHPVIAETSGA